LGHGLGPFSGLIDKLDTLDYLLEKRKAWDFKAGCLHGGMKPGSRDEPGLRLYSEPQFRD